MIPVLIVDDEFLVRMGLKSAVNWEDEGFFIAGEAANGDEAMAMYNQLSPSLILTDIKMPKKDGISLMREIRERDANVKFIVLTAYNEFSYAQECIGIGVEAFLLKGTLITDELTGILGKLRVQLLEDGLPSPSVREDTRAGIYVEDVRNKKQCFEELGLPLNFGTRFHICCARISGVHRDLALQRSFVQLGLKIIEEKGIRYIHLKHDEYFYVLLPDTTPPRECMEMLSEAGSRYLDKKLYCGISKPAPLQEPVYQYILQARAACNMNILKTDMSGIRSYVPEERANSAKIGAALNDLEWALLHGDYNRCRAVLEDIKNELAAHPNVKLFFRTLYRVALILAMRDDNLLETEIQETLLAIDRIDLIFEELDRLFFDMCGKLASLAPQSSHYVEMARVYVRNNIEKRLKLRDISEQIHLSPNYLGKLFYNETGVYLTEYIMNERINLSCKLLKDNGRSISEVASMVGIGDQQYFSKMFKKKMGLSPKEYAQGCSLNTK